MDDLRLEVLELTHMERFASGDSRSIHRTGGKWSRSRPEDTRARGGSFGILTLEAHAPIWLAKYKDVQNGQLHPVVTGFRAHRRRRRLLSGSTMLGVRALAAAALAPGAIMLFIAIVNVLSVSSG